MTRGVALVLVLQVVVLLDGIDVYAVSSGDNTHCTLSHEEGVKRLNENVLIDAYWPLNDGEGASIVREVIHGRDGVPSGTERMTLGQPSILPNGVGRSVRFSSTSAGDTTSSRIIAPAWLKWRRRWAMCFWIRPHSAPDPTVAANILSDDNGTLLSRAVLLNPDFAIRSHRPSGADGVGPVIPTGVTTHVCAAYRGATARYYWYYNGTEAEVELRSTQPVTKESVPFYIGRDDAPGAVGGDYSISDVVVFEFFSTESTYWDAFSYLYSLGVNRTCTNTQSTTASPPPSSTSGKTTTPIGTHTKSLPETISETISASRRALSTTSTGPTRTISNERSDTTSLHRSSETRTLSASLSTLSLTAPSLTASNSLSLTPTWMVSGSFALSSSFSLSIAGVGETQSTPAATFSQNPSSTHREGVTSTLNPQSSVTGIITLSVTSTDSSHGGTGSQTKSATHLTTPVKPSAPPITSAVPGTRRPNATQPPSMAPTAAPKVPPPRPTPAPNQRRSSLTKTHTSRRPRGTPDPATGPSVNGTSALTVTQSRTEDEHSAGPILGRTGNATAADVPAPYEEVYTPVFLASTAAVAACSVMIEPLMGSTVTGGMILFELQTMFIVGLMPCASPESRVYLYRGLLSPVQMGNHALGYWLGTIVLGGFLCGVHYALYRIWGHLSELSDDEIRLKIRYPRFQFLVASLLFPSLSFESWLLLLVGDESNGIDSEWILLCGLVGLLMSIFYLVFVIGKSITFFRAEKRRTAAKRLTVGRGGELDPSMREGVPLSIEELGSRRHESWNEQMAVEMEQLQRHSIAAAAAERGGNEVKDDENSSCHSNEDPRATHSFLLYSHGQLKDVSCCASGVCRTLLYPDGYWAPSVAVRSSCIVMPNKWVVLRFSVTAPYIRTFFISCLAAIPATGQAQCLGVAICIAVISFGYTVALCSLRWYRIPVMNAFCSVQSLAVTGLAVTHALRLVDAAPSTVIGPILLTAIAATVLGAVGSVLTFLAERRSMIVVKPDIDAAGEKVIGEVILTGGDEGYASSPVPPASLNNLAGSVDVVDLDPLEGDRRDRGYAIETFSGSGSLPAPSRPNPAVAEHSRDQLEPQDSAQMTTVDDGFEEVQRSEIWGLGYPEGDILLTAEIISRRTKSSIVGALLIQTVASEEAVVVTGRQ